MFVFGHLVSAIVRCQSLAEFVGKFCGKLVQHVLKLHRKSCVSFQASLHLRLNFTCCWFDLIYWIELIIKQFIIISPIFWTECFCTLCYVVFQRRLHVWIMSIRIWIIGIVESNVSFAMLNNGVERDSFCLCKLRYLFASIGFHIQQTLPLSHEPFLTVSLYC